jgi:hypothetical protein
MSAGTEGKPVWTWVATIAFVTFAVRFTAVLSGGHYLSQSYHEENHEVIRVAIALATSGSISDPFVSLSTGPTAHVSPGYPVLLSVVFRLFGTGSHGELAKAALACLISAMQYALLPLITSLLAIPVEVGLKAGLLGACLPIDWAIESLGESEANLAGVLLIVLVALTAKTHQQRYLSRRDAVLRGFLWGIASLFSAALLAVGVGLTVVGLALRTGTVRSRLRLGGYVATGILVALAPWGLRNWRELGYPVLTRSNLGLEMYVSNNDLAAPALAENMQSLEAFHPTFNADVAAELRDEGEVRFNDRYLRRAIAWIKANRLRFVILTLDRIAHFWLGTYSGATARQVVVCLLTLGGFSGLIMLWAENKRMTWILWTVQLTFPLIYYFVQTSPRYRYPVNWVALIGTVYAFSRFAGKQQERNTRCG